MLHHFGLRAVDELVAHENVSFTRLIANGLRPTRIFGWTHINALTELPAIFLGFLLFTFEVSVPVYFVGQKAHGSIPRLKFAQSGIDIFTSILKTSLHTLECLLRNLKESDLRFDTVVLASGA